VRSRDPCAGIRFERGEQTFARIHRQGTLQVIKAVRQAGVRKVVLLSFLRARPSCGLPFHESKWTAEELVRRCGLDFTILKYGVIYGPGDHMLDHLSHGYYTFPFFHLLGSKTGASDQSRLRMSRGWSELRFWKGYFLGARWRCWVLNF